MDGLRESCLLGAHVLFAQGFSTSLGSEPQLCQRDVCTPLFRHQMPVVHQCAMTLFV